VSERLLTARLGASAAVVQRVAQRAAELADAVRECFVLVARPVVEQFDQGEHLARVDDLDRPARPDGLHLLDDRLRRGRLQGARLQILADTPRHLDLSIAHGEVDAVESLRHGLLFRLLEVDAGDVSAQMHNELRHLLRVRGPTLDPVEPIGELRSLLRFELHDRLVLEAESDPRGKDRLAVLLEQGRKRFGVVAVQPERLSDVEAHEVHAAESTA
jgi:hypothetical protein